MKLIDLLTEVKMYESLGLPASAVQSLDSFVAQELDEADMLGAGTTELPSDELQGYLDRSAGNLQFIRKLDCLNWIKKVNKSILLQKIQLINSSIHMYIQSLPERYKL